MTQQQTILVADDEPGLVQALAINLRARGWNVVTAGTGAGALEAAAKRRPDLVVLDLGLPDMDGVDVIRGIRGWSAVPIIILSARHDSDEKVSALDAGADDYVTKPFGMDEFLARIRAALRRAQPSESDAPVVQAGELRIDLAAKKISRNGAELRLTPTEWHFLEILVRHRGRLVTHEQLLQQVWGPSYRTQSNYLRVYSAQLRRKLEADPAHPRHLITEAGMGYRFETD
ncbi:response regulator [Microlunatus panaciterrae]|uniref:Two-component system KDP operon response regulator KdpE n=1 Tax=Microlunatus panaciterrae TaxID=400768 RepID=A0ABS2RJ12_9ACTN|nr:response regulator [Microlunatus panaciterrae]MBM7798567.1 two-component system KDP operon response regulator KdpE [Microlunatus panaciterrae]